MARINIEDDLFKDGRFTKLCIALGSRRLAIGALVEAWILAQQYVSPENPTAKIPVSDWEDQDIAPEILTSRLAKIIDVDFVEISGAQEHFAWLVQKQVAAKKGGAAKSKQKIEASPAVPEAAGTMPEQPETCPPTLTLTLSPTLTQNHSLSQKKQNNMHRTEKTDSTQSAKAVAVVEVEVDNSLIIFSSDKQISIKRELLQAWADTYDKDFLDLSFKEMRNWVLSNPHKAPKSAWSKFMNSWFQRGWESYRKTLKSEKSKLTIEDMHSVFGVTQ